MPVRVRSRAPSPWVGLSAVGVGVFMGTLDSSVVNVALPTLRTAFGVRLVTVEWVLSAYLLVISAALLTLGRWGDLLGHRRIFVGGFLGFTAGSALCASAGSLGGLLAARVVQAFGAGALLALGPAIVTALFPARKRGQALGVVASIVAAGLTAGPPLGGLLLEHLSWRWIFLINVPIGLFGALYAHRVLPPLREGRETRFDWPGAFLMAGAFTALIVALTLMGEARRASLPLLVVAVGAAGGFARWERSAASSLLPLSLFRASDFRSGILSVVFAFTALFASTLLLPFYLSHVRGLSPRAMGLVLTSVPLALSLTAPCSGWLSDRVGTRWLCAGGMALLALGLLSLSRLGPHDSIGSVCLRLALAGVGMGLFQPPNNSRVMGSLPRERLGSGGGALATARNVGMVVGVAVAGSLFASRTHGRLEPRFFLNGFALALEAAAGVALAAGLVSLLGARREGPSWETPEGLPQTSVALDPEPHSG